MDKIRFKKIIKKGIANYVKFQAVKICPRFYKFLRAKPYDLFINITDNCCHRCLTCAQWRTTTYNELTLNEWKKVITQARDFFDINSLIIIGGEPFLRNDLEQVIAFATSKRIIARIVTNGYLVNKKNAEEVISAGAKAISVSIDAIGELHNRIRGRKKAFDRALRAVRIFRNLLVETYISTTISKLNLEEILLVVKLAQKEKVKIVFNLYDQTPYFFKNVPDKEQLAITGRADLKKVDNLVGRLIRFKKENPSAIANSFSDLLYIKKYFRDPLQKKLPCAASQTRIMISSQGDVYGGCWSMDKFGNIRQKSLKQIFESEKYLRQHKKMFFKNCPGCSCGFPVNLQYSPKTLYQETRHRFK